eukprot:TRINITY_DN10672_c0_g1_i1.p1 TRINITY_DN10672_c0_g1~~TRINITY_DN10672_c0_g1_i1.p1  ORF type:complete len:599 (+),score=136.70 TRINITY_DN10672_c0_g1_i1:106-1902(+)
MEPTGDYAAMPLAQGGGETLASMVEKRAFELSAFTAEFFGTFVIVFTAACVELMPAAEAWAWTALACAVMVMVYSSAAISGGNLNPAVSLSLGVLGALDWRTVLGYCVAQLLGGLLAGFCAETLFYTKVIGVGPVAPYPWYLAATAELTYTAMLCFVYCHCVASKRNNPKVDGNQFFGLAVGFVMVAGGYAAGGISRARFNPAVAFGLLPLSGFLHGLPWTSVWFGFELLGALLAAGLFRTLRLEEWRLSAADLVDYKATIQVRCFSEFLGTFMLVLTVGLSMVQNSPAVAWAAGASLMCMIYSLGDVSGGHFNPAVTLAAVLKDRNKCSPQDGLLYCLVQLLAGAAAGILYACYHAAGPMASISYGLVPGYGYSIWKAGLAELIFTAVLCYVVLACASGSSPLAHWPPVAAPSQKSGKNFYFALAIGSCVTLAGFAVGNISGGEINPAVSLGIAVASKIHHRPHGPSPPSFINFLVIGVFELVGGALAAGIFRFTHPKEWRSSRHELPVVSVAAPRVTFATGGATAATGASTKESEAAKASEGQKATRSEEPQDVQQPQQAQQAEAAPQESTGAKQKIQSSEVGFKEGVGRAAEAGA